VAFGAEVAKSTISRLLSGKLNPTVRLLEKIANHFEIDIKTLFD
jgi:transcriptional regulator with XRE-family HTH domain